MTRVLFPPTRIGGSFSKEDILGILATVNSHLPEDKPRHLLGISEPEDVFIGVEAGIDTFDCVLPTRNARNGTLYTKSGKINITNAAFAETLSPLDAGCDCYTCRHFTKSYVHHLFKANEMLGPILATMHNLRFMVRLIDDIRTALTEGRFKSFKEAFFSTYKK